LNCGKEFTPIKPYSKFCSYQCVVDYRRRGKTTIKCKGCGREFVPIKSYSKYCSYACFNEHRKRESSTAKQLKAEQKKKEQEEWEKISPADKLLFQKQKERNPELTRKEFMESL
jgi:hypothetical protein